MAKKKLNPFDLLAAKEAKKAKQLEASKKAEELEVEIKKMKMELEAEESPEVPIKKVVRSAKRVKDKKSVISKSDSNGGRKLIRVANEVHKFARFNEQHLTLNDYVESLIRIADNNGVDWSKLSTAKKIELTDHKEEEKRTLFRILPEYHTLVRFNDRSMKVQTYIEALVLLDKVGAIDWSKNS